MSDDPLLREIDEELRQDQLKALWKRHGGLIVGVTLAIVVGVAGFNGWNAWQSSQRLQQTALLDAAVDEQALQTAAGADAKAIADRLADELLSLNGGAAALARLYHASALARSGDLDGAARGYDQVGADVSVPLALREAASVLAVMHRLTIAEPAVLEAQLAPLAAESSPWRFTAREMQAVLALRTGDRAKAQQAFSALADAAEAPRGLRQRAREMASHLVGQGA